MSTKVEHRDQEDGEQKRIRGIYLLPNLFTTGGIFAGFYAIVAAMKGQFTFASIAIFIAMIADGLDGRVARLTNTSSIFGAQYDSLADMVAFGVAPALIAYSWALHDLGKLGWLAAFFYAVAGALRLARFNSQVDTPAASKRYFQGLPIPAAAGCIAGMIWVQNVYQLQGSVLNIFDSIVVVMLGILMISNIGYRSFKDIDLKGHVPFLYIIVVVLFFVCIALDPPEVLFAIFGLYAISGPLASFVRLKNRKKHKIGD
jgi:CDP-diacylglycerol---serine O-phosphatidyltransferase